MLPKVKRVTLNGWLARDVSGKLYFYKVKPRVYKDHFIKRGMLAVQIDVTSLFGPIFPITFKESPIRITGFVMMAYDSYVNLSKIKGNEIK